MSAAKIALKIGCQLAGRATSERVRLIWKNSDMSLSKRIAAYSKPTRTIANYSASGFPFELKNTLNFILRDYGQMKIEFESFNQMQYRYFWGIIAAIVVLWKGFKALAVILFCFVMETVLFPIAKSRRAKAAYIRKLWRTRDEILRGRRGNGFTVKTRAENETH